MTAAAYRLGRSCTLATRAAREIVVRDVAALRTQLRSPEAAALRTAATNVLWRGKVPCAARAATRASALRSWQTGRYGAQLLRASMAENRHDLVIGSIAAIVFGLAFGLLLR